MYVGAKGKAMMRKSIDTFVAKFFVIVFAILIM